MRAVAGAAEQLEGQRAADDAHEAGAQPEQHREQDGAGRRRRGEKQHGETGGERGGAPSASQVCGTPPPNSMLMKRLATCDGPNRLATNTPAVARPTAAVSGTMCTRMADGTKPSIAKPSIRTKTGDHAACGA